MKTQYSKWYFYKNLKPKEWTWNEIMIANGVGDHFHKFQFGSFGILIDHFGSPSTWTVNGIPYKKFIANKPLNPTEKLVN